MGQLTIRKGQNLNAQTKITQLVEGYKKLFPTEYLLVVEQLKKIRLDQTNTFSEIREKGVDGEWRKIYEIPETLHNIFIQNLTDEDKAYLETKNGSFWFAKRFEEFKIAEKL